MKTRPILFNTRSVQAILDGRKTQTRRIWKKPKRHTNYDVYPVRAADHFWLASGEFCIGEKIHCPYGQPGDRLWIREAWRQVGFNETQAQIIYKADGEYSDNYYWFDSDRRKVDSHWCPSIYMPRWTSRITLEILNVRVERVQDISESDAQAEGCVPAYTTNYFPLLAKPDEWTHRADFACLWDKVNKHRLGIFGWDVNPWVWVVEFRVLKGENEHTRDNK